MRCTAWKVSVFVVFLVRIFPHLDWKCIQILRIFPYLVQMRKNTNQKNSEYGHFSRRFISMNYFHQFVNFSNIQIHLTRSVVEQNTSRNHFSQVFSMIGISWIQKFKILAIIAYFANPWVILINDLENFDQSLPTLSKVNHVDILLCDNEHFNDKKLRYNIMHYKIPKRFSKICKTTVVNLACLWYPVTSTICPPFPSSLQHFPQKWLLQILVFVFELLYLLLYFISYTRSLLALDYTK